jgi:hypothetical protein
MLDKHAKRTETADSARYLRDQEEMRRVSLVLLGEYRKLYPVFKLQGAHVSNIENEKKLLRELRKGIEEDPAVFNFLKDFPDQEKDKLVKLGMAVGLGRDLKKVEGLVVKIFDESYIQSQTQEDKRTLKKNLPEAVLEFLPERLVIKTDPNGVIEEITNRFQEQYETIGKKIDIQKKILIKYEEISDKLKKDLQSSDEQTKLAALIMSIIMETGIRPGKPGTSSKKRSKDGEATSTYGAITLLPEHISFLKDTEVELRFPGKSGTINVSSIQNKDIILLLKKYVEHTQSVIEGEDSTGPKAVFTTNDGKTLTPEFLRRYVKKLGVQGLRPTDFRKLRSTQAVLNSLNSQLEGLYNRISQAVNNQTEDLRERVVQEVISTVKEAYKHAERTLSHEDVKTTIDHYINPTPLLEFLSKGTISKDLKEAIVNNKTTLSFDPQVFIDQAMNRKTPDAGILKTSSDGNQKMVAVLYKLAKLASSTRMLVPTREQYTFRY